MRRFLTSLAAGLLIGCANPFAPRDLTPDLPGRVDFGATRHAQATLDDVGKGATVSLISASTGQTIRTALTNDQGKFVITFGSWKPDASELYYIEAIKGLNNNQAGNSTARVRTLGKFVSGTWNTLTGGAISVTSTTTAISIIASHLGTTTVPPTSLLETIAIGTADASLTPTTPDTFAYSGTGITNAQYHQVYGFVEQALQEDSDPMDRVSRNGGSFILKSPAGSLSLPSPTLYTAYPTSGPVGAFITLFGKDFEGDNASNSISFNGVLTTPYSSYSDKLVVQVPSGATTGTLTVRTRSGTSQGTPFSVTPADPATIGGTFTPR